MQQKTDIEQEPTPQVAAKLVRIELEEALSKQQSLSDTQYIEMVQGMEFNVRPTNAYFSDS
jgi:hypothetical protein